MFYLMNRTLIIIIISASLVILFIFFAPVIPASSLYPSIAEITGHLHYYYYYKSISGIFLPIGTSYYKGIYYFHPIPLSGYF